MILDKQTLIYHIDTPTTVDTILSFWHLGKKTRYELYQSCSVLVNDKVIKQSCNLSVGDTLSIITDIENARIQKRCPIDILYEDDILLIVYKQKGYLVHSDGTKRDNIQDILCKYYTDSIANQLQAIHRIDVDTSGILMFSKSIFFQPILDNMVQNNRIKRSYLAIVEGILPDQIIDQSIAKDRHDAKKMRISSNGKPALTHVKHIVSYGNQSLVQCYLETGRTHQIRVHMASIAHPIVGDVLYNKKKSKHALCLHSYSVIFQHPITQEVVQLKVKPKDEDFLPQFDLDSITQLK